MKKLFATLVSLFLVASMTFALTACNKSGEEFKGNYKETTKEELQTLIDSITDANKMKVKNVGDAYYTDLLIEQSSGDDSMKTDMSLSFDGTNNLIALYVTATQTMSGNEQSAELAAYIDEQNAYSYEKMNDQVAETMNPVVNFELSKQTFAGAYETQVDQLFVQALDYFKVVLENEDLISKVTVAEGKDFINLKLDYTLEFAQAGEDANLLTYSDASGEVILSFRSEDYSIRAAKIAVNEEYSMMGQTVKANVYCEIASLKEDVQVPEVLKNYYEMKNE